MVVTVDAAQTIEEIVQQREETRLVFLRHHVPVGRFAHWSLAAASAECGIDLALLVRELDQAIEESESFDLGGFEWDVRGRSVRLSPNLARIFALSDLNTAQRTILDRVHPDDRARVEHVFSDAAAHPHSLSFEFRVLRPDGAVRLFAMRAEPLDAEPPSFVGTIWDVTEQHRRPTHVYDASSSSLQSALEATADGILVVDRAGNTMLYNTRFVSLWRIPPEIAAKGTDDAMLQFVIDQLAEPQAFLADVQRLYSSPERESFDVLRFKDGRVFERYSRPQRARFAVIGRVWSFRDVTERETLLARQTFLVDASRLLGSLDVESALDAVGKAAIPYLGDICVVEIFEEGASRRVVSHSIDARAPAPALPAETRAGRSTITDVEGSSVLAVPILVQQKPVGAIMLFAPHRRRHTRVDIETVEELARRIALALDNARLLREAQRAARARDDFLSVAAHEIRGPLASMHLAAETLQRHELQDATRQKIIDLIVREDRKLARFVDDILDVTRIRTGGLSFDDVDVDLVAVVRDVVANLSTDIQRSHSTLSVDATHPVVGRWDRVRLEQVVTNLVQNALKFGLGKPIEASVDAHDGHATLTVSDHGLGVAPEQRETIFEPFKRAVPVRNYGGLGLGLSIVRAIVKRYGGSVRVEPRNSGGSTFVVQLPLAKAA